MAGDDPSGHVPGRRRNVGVKLDSVGFDAPKAFSNVNIEKASSLRSEGLRVGRDSSPSAQNDIIYSTRLDSATLCCHAGENRHPEPFEIPGFRVAVAVATLPGMTTEFCRELLGQGRALKLCLL